MRNTTLVEKNIDLSFEFTRYLLDHPELEDRIPKGAQVVLLPEYDEKLKHFNMQTAKKQREEGQPVVYVSIKRLALDRASRLVGTKIERIEHAA